MELTEFGKLFGNYIKRLMERRNMTVYRLSKLTGMSKTHLREIIEGEGNACLDSIRKLHLALEQPLDMFDEK